MQANGIQRSMHICEERVKHFWVKEPGVWTGGLWKDPQCAVDYCASKKFWVLWRITAFRTISWIFWIFFNSPTYLVYLLVILLFEWLIHDIITSAACWVYGEMCLLCQGLCGGFMSQWESFFVLNAWLKPRALCDACLNALWCVTGLMWLMNAWQGL